MVTSRTTWYAEDNSPHETKLEALRRDLQIMLKPLVDSDAIAARVVAGMTAESAEALYVCLNDLAQELATDAN